MFDKRAARVAASLVVLALLAGACGRKGPLYLPDGAGRTPASGAPAAPTDAERTAR